MPGVLLIANDGRAGETPAIIVSPDTWLEQDAECDRAGATTEQFCYNLSKTLTQANSPENVYCRSCVDKIEKYINCDMAITERTYITDKPGK